MNINNKSNESDAKNGRSSQVEANESNLDVNETLENTFEKFSNVPNLNEKVKNEAEIKMPEELETSANYQSELNKETVEIQSNKLDTNQFQTVIELPEINNSSITSTTSTSTPSTTSTSTATPVPTAQVPTVVTPVIIGNGKDAVLMRLSNRVKILELNMTLSSQYLEKLSQHYR